MLKRLRGVSGSPVFVVLPPARTKRHENKSGVYITLQANTEFYLLGVMATHFGLNDPKDMRELVNLGVAVQTPRISGKELIRQSKTAAGSSPTREVGVGSDLRGGVARMMMSIDPLPFPIPVRGPQNYSPPCVTYGHFLKPGNRTRSVRSSLQA